jgi:hypothetical protein
MEKQSSWQRVATHVGIKPLTTNLRVGRSNRSERANFS